MGGSWNQNPIELENHFAVAHSVEKWLPITMTWVYNQLKYGKNVSALVLTNATQNLDKFPWHSITTASKSDYLVLRVVKKLGLSYRPLSEAHNQVIRKKHPRILHSHFGDKGWYDIPLRNKHNLKHVVTFYGYDLSLLPAQKPVWKFRFQELFEESHIFLCEGPHMAESLINLGCPHTKVKVLRLGIEVEKFQYSQRLLKKNEDIKILIAGTFREKKGIPYALLAISKLKAKHPNLRVTVIGDSTGTSMEEREKRRIMSVVNSQNMESMVEFQGFQTHNRLLEEAYRHHIFLSPSVTAEDGDVEGGAPVTIIEMAATGIPVVSSYHCDIPQIIENGKTGYLAEERDVDGLAEHLSFLIDHPDSWKALTFNARKYIEKNFNIISQTEKLEEVYRALDRN